MEDENYIDKLYKDSFQSFEIQPKKRLNFKEHQQLANTVEKKTFLQKLFATKWGIGLSIAFVVGIVGVIVLMTKDEHVKTENIKIEAPVIEPKIIEEAIVVADTAPTIETTPVKTEIKNQPTDTRGATPTKKVEKLKRESESPEDVQEPVIIRKTIIKRDTVIKHEKVIQNVPATNEK
jgi:hypothetical protein